MNDDALFLVIFFCTTLLSGLGAALEQHPLQAGRSLQTHLCGGNAVHSGFRARLCAAADTLIGRAGGTLPEGNTEPPALASERNTCHANGTPR